MSDDTTTAKGNSLTVAGRARRAAEYLFQITMNIANGVKTPLQLIDMFKCDVQIVIEWAKIHKPDSPRLLMEDYEKMLSASDKVRTRGRPKVLPPAFMAGGGM